MRDKSYVLQEDKHRICLQTDIIIFVDWSQACPKDPK